MFTITITETKQSDHGPLFEKSFAHDIPDPAQAEPERIEHARINVAHLDVPALINLIYRKPKKERADKGKKREKPHAAAQ